VQGGKYWIALAFACALAAPLAHAESLIETYRLALKADPRLAAARLDYEASEHAKRAARAALFPTVRAEVERTQERQNILSSQNAVIGAGISSFPIEVMSLTITQPLFRVGAAERLDQAEISRRQAGVQQAAAQQNLMVRVATAYLGVLAAQDNLEYATAERVAVGRQLQLAEERVSRGLATVVNLHDAKSRFAQTEAQEVEARNALEDSQQAIREMAGALPKSYVRVRTDFPAVSPEPAAMESWVETALSRNLGLEARQLAAEVAAQEVRRQRGAYWPTLDLVATHANRKQGGTLFGGGSHVETTDLSLRMSMPIFEGGLTNALTDEAVVRHRRALEEVEQERRAVERQTRSAYLGVVGAISRVKALQQGVASQEAALKGKQESFRAGILTLLAVLDSERDLYLSLRDFARARYDYLLNRLRLKQAVGSLSDEDLAAFDRLAQ
jgi:outer membrane protein